MRRQRLNLLQSVRSCPWAIISTCYYSQILQILHSENFVQQRSDPHPSLRVPLSRDSDNTPAPAYILERRRNIIGCVQHGMQSLDIEHAVAQALARNEIRAVLPSKLEAEPALVATGAVCKGNGGTLPMLDLSLPTAATRNLYSYPILKLKQQM